MTPPPRAGSVRFSQRAVPWQPHDTSRPAFVVSSSSSNHRSHEGAPSPFQTHLCFRHDPGGHQPSGSDAAHGSCTDSNHDGLPSTHSAGCPRAIRSCGCPTHSAHSTVAVMKRQRLPLPTHPLTRTFGPAAESVTTSLSEASVTSYRRTVRHFLNYLGIQYPEVRSLDQLCRDPHILGWLALLRSHNPP